MDNCVVWFEIPVKNMERAMKFYSQLLQIEMQAFNKGPIKMGFFPFQPGSVSGSLVEHPENTPSQTGTIVYFNGGDDLSAALSRVEPAGGKILQEKMSIGEHGFIAIFLDTEGNRVALHSQN